MLVLCCEIAFFLYICTTMTGTMAFFEILKNTRYEI